MEIGASGAPGASSAKCTLAPKSSQKAVVDLR